MVRHFPKVLIGLVCLALWSETALAQIFSDMFAGRQLLTNINFVVTGSNSNATVEPGEPEHAGKIGGHSVWVSWLAPADGLVTLSTAGSSFDTLLAVYTLPPGTNQSLQRLRGYVADDDYGGLVTSYVQFGANAGQIYQIAVDGFNGATGNVLLQLNFLSSANLQPTIISQSGDHSLRLGDPLIINVNLISSPNLEFTWYLNGSPVAGQDDDFLSPTLVIPSLQSSDLGLYSLKLYLNDDSFFSSVIEIQVNSEGQAHVLARNKIADAAQSGLVGGFLLGYNGEQIFNTTNAIVDTNAPDICGVAPGPAYWFSYQAPASGLMTVTTTNSSFATLLAAFTYSGVLNSYTDLVSVACDNNSGGTGTNTSSIQFMVSSGSSYFIVVGGVSGARGVAQLNYSLNADPPAKPPLVSVQPQPMLVATQAAVTLSVTASGTAPIAYQWWKNKSGIPQQTNATLLLRNPQIRDSGIYSVVMTNIVGAVTSSPANVSVVGQPVVSLVAPSNQMVTAFPAIRGYQYSADTCPDLASGTWSYWTNAFPDNGGMIWLTNAVSSSDALFLRVHSP